MGRILVVIFGAAVVLGAAWFYATGGAGARSDLEVSAPKKTLDNVRQAADRIEDDAQRRADELLERTAGDQAR